MCYNLRMKVAIMGAGAYGTALGGILAGKGYDIDYYDPKVYKEPLVDVVEGASFVVLAAPSFAAPYLLPHLPKKTPLVVATKGILDTDAFDKFADVMAVSGPGFADDIKAHKRTILTATDPRVIEMFSTDYLSFDFTDDFRGVLFCGALKNVYAILAGLSDFEAKTDEWEQFIDETCNEMKAIFVANGVNPDTVNLSCGVGDLRLTCNYPSRNYEFGRILKKNPNAQPEKTVEGLTALGKIKRGEIIVPESATKLKSLIEMSKTWN